MTWPTLSRAKAVGLLVVLTGLTGLTTACGGGRQPAVVPDQQADTYLFQQGMQALERRRWLSAREYFRRLVDTYPTSPHRQDAKLGIGDSYLGEGRVESDVLAVGEFREFLRFYPLATRADYAQYRLAFGQVKQVLSPERDQTATLEALRELGVFLANYPNSKHTAEVIRLQREMRDHLSRSEFLVGRHYFRSRWTIGAIARLEALLKADPQFTGRDGVYFYLAESLNRQNKPAEARAYYQKLIDEFRVSEYLEDAGKRLAVLGPPKPGEAAPSSAAAATAATAPAPPSPPASTGQTPTTSVTPSPR